MRGELERDEAALYDLVWKRTVASQMADARGETVSVRLGATARPTAATREFGTAGTVITFRGFLLAYEEGRDEAGRRRRGGAAPAAARRGRRGRGDASSSRTATRPSRRARYTEATLVRALEERGIGRPSTYATIMGTILDRGYVRKEGQALVPSFLAFAVTNLLEQHFGAARRLRVHGAAGGRPRPDRRRHRGAERLAAALLLRRQRAGRATGLKALVSDLGDIDARAINTIEIGDGIELRVGRYGPYIERDGQRVTISDDIAPDELTVERAEELLAQGSEQRELGTIPRPAARSSSRTAATGRT